MSRGALEEILARAVDDDPFRRLLLLVPAEAVAGYDLTGQERQALIAGDLRRILLVIEGPR